MKEDFNILRLVCKVIRHKPMHPDKNETLCKICLSYMVKFNGKWYA